MYAIVGQNFVCLLLVNPEIKVATPIFIKKEIAEGWMMETNWVLLLVWYIENRV